jgi:hypothetical protein
MALTAEEIQEKIDALDLAIAARERSVQFSDRSVTYKSGEEMLEARAHLVSLLSRSNGRAKQSLATSHKGFF